MTVMVPIRAGFAAALVASLFLPQALAQDSSPWVKDGHSAVRLLTEERLEAAS